MPIETVDDVLTELTRIVTGATDAGKRVGYFAALYRRTTTQINADVLAGTFDDNDRMSRLIVAFASRYFDALRNFLAGVAAPRCWQAAFEAGDTNRYIVLQHLLLGMVAHINFDLGAGIAAVVGADELTGFRRDFDHVHDILGGTLSDTQARLDRVSPWLAVIDVAGGMFDESLGNFGLQELRERSWKVAERIVGLAAADRDAELDRVDVETVRIGQGIRNPTGLAACTVLLARLVERRNIPGIITELNADR